MVAKKRTNEIKITRLYDAPVKLVWEAWTDPKQVTQWWGPRGFSLTHHSKGLRPGGTWVYTMHGPDGVDYPNVTTYFEVEKYRRLVYDHGASGDKPPLFRVTVNFQEVKGQTQMNMTMTFASPEVAEDMEKFIKAAGGNATWDRLAEYLGQEHSGKNRFVINRSFEVPVDKMFDLWTQPEHFSRWLPPKGFRMEFLKVDIKAGGSSVYLMTNDAGVTMYGKANYLEIRRPDRFVYTQQFCDDKGQVSRHPFAPNWPETMLTVVSLTAEGPDQTRVTVTWEPFGNVTPEELATFLRERGGMTMGWTGSFDKLEDYLGSTEQESK